MTTEKVGIYRKYHGPVPLDNAGNPLPKSEWPRKRLFRWAVRWFGSEGKRYSKSFTGRKEAERFAEDKQSEVRSGKSDPPPQIRLKDFAREHLMLMKGQITSDTLREHERSLRYLIEIVGNRTIATVTPQHAEQYIMRRSETGVSVSTLNKELVTLRRIFSIAAERRGYLPKGQNCFRTIAKRKVSAKPLRYISPVEFRKLLEFVPSLKWKVLLSVFYTTGLRLGEACNLCWNDIDFEQGIIQVSPKRNPESLIPWEPKDHEIRHIPMCKELTDVLVRWQTEITASIPYVFLTVERYAWVMEKFKNGQWPVGGELMNNVLRDFNIVRRRAGISRCTIHDLRRSCITNWAHRMPAHVVRKLAGHSSLETTMKYYLSVQEVDLSGAKDVGSHCLGLALPDKSSSVLWNAEAYRLTQN